MGSINIRTGNEKSEGAKMYAITKEVARAGRYFCLLQEVHYRNNRCRRIHLTREMNTTSFGAVQSEGEMEVDNNIVYSQPDYQNIRINSNKC